MNVLVFGASGGTGLELIRQGLEQGHAMTAFVRNPSVFNISHPQLAIVQGDVVISSAIENAVKGQDAAICALGASSLLKRDPSLVVGIHNILTAMLQANVKRLIYLSHDAVHEVRGQLNPLGRYLIAPILLRNASADHEVNEAMIRQSRLGWTIARAAKLTNGPQTGVYRSGAEVHAKSLIAKISRADLADFMLKQLSQRDYVRAAPTVMY